MILSAVVGAVGSIVSGIATMQASNYQAAIAKANAEQARVNAALATQKAEADAQDRDIENAGLFGLQTARQGASGLALDSPSLIKTRARSIELASVERDRIYRAGYAQSANYETEANSLDAQAKMYKSQGKFAMLSGIIGAGSNLIAGAKSTAMGSSPSFMPIASPRPSLFGRV